MEELFPFVGGLLVGILFGALRPRVRWFVCPAVAVALAVAATVLSGEFRVSWAYLAVDLPLVVLGALVARRLTALGLARRRATAQE
jgi:nitrogen fixation/metabolism regulation signal transduction histidine kinase